MLPWGHCTVWLLQTQDRFVLASTIRALETKAHSSGTLLIYCHGTVPEVNFSSCSQSLFIDSPSTFPDTSDLCCYTAYFILYNIFPQNKFNNVSTSFPMMRGSYSISDCLKSLLKLSAWIGAFVFFMCGFSFVAVCRDVLFSSMENHIPVCSVFRGFILLNTDQTEIQSCCCVSLPGVCVG